MRADTNIYHYAIVAHHHRHAAFYRCETIAAVNRHEWPMTNMRRSILIREMRAADEDDGR